MAAKKRHYASMKGAYEGVADRRRQEMEDAGMLHEDRKQVANMPQEVMYHGWPKAMYGAVDSDLDDTIMGVNRQMDKDESQARRFMNPHKY